MKKIIVIMFFIFNSKIFAINLGALDTSFSNDGVTDGWVLDGVNGSSLSGQTIAVDRLGRILVAGVEVVFGQGFKVVVRRYLPDGTYDNTLDSEFLGNVLLEPKSNNIIKVGIELDELNGFFLGYSYNSCAGIDTCIDTIVYHISENGSILGGDSIVFDAGAVISSQDDDFVDMVYFTAEKKLAVAVDVKVDNSPTYNKDFGVAVFNILVGGGITPDTGFGSNGHSGCFFNQDNTGHNDTDEARAITANFEEETVIVGGWSFEGNGSASIGKNMSFCEFNLVSQNGNPPGTVIEKWSTEIMPDSPFIYDEEILYDLKYHTEYVETGSGLVGVKTIIATGIINGANSDDFALIKYFYDGMDWVPDTSFGPYGTGWARAGFSLLNGNNGFIDTEDVAKSLFIESEDGAILIGGYSEWYDTGNRRIAGALLKFTKNGILDKNWGDNKSGKTMVILDDITNIKIISDITIAGANESIFTTGTYPGAFSGNDSLLITKHINDSIFSGSFDD
ncbi:MAG: hypothetical protein R3E90_09780 [Marinicella sp.]|nr:hypothetical protein [Xanthomonadales bacterium]